VAAIFWWCFQLLDFDHMGFFSRITILGPTPAMGKCQARGKLFLVLFFFFHFKSFFLFFFFSTFLKLARLLRQCSGFNDLA